MCVRERESARASCLAPRHQEFLQPRKLSTERTRLFSLPVQKSAVIATKHCSAHISPNPQRTLNSHPYPRTLNPQLTPLPPNPKPSTQTLTPKPPDPKPKPQTPKPPDPQTLTLTYPAPPWPRTNVPHSATSDSRGSAAPCNRALMPRCALERARTCNPRGRARCRGRRQWRRVRWPRQWRPPPADHRLMSAPFSAG